MIGPATQAGEIGPGLQTALQSLDPQEEIPVIITLADKADLNLFKGLKGADKHLLRSLIVDALKNQAKTARGPLMNFLHDRGGRGIIELWIINGLAAVVPGGLVPEIAALPGVESVRLDGTVHAPKNNPGNPSPFEWNISAIHAPDLWDLGATGAGVVVANMDTGVDPDHPDLSSNWRGGTNSWYDPNGEHSSPADLNGHGTQTMGIMVGGSAGGTAIGVAPDARWIAVKIYNDDDTALYSVIHLGFQWLLDPDGNSGTDDAPDVVNISWGLEMTNTCSSEFQPDMQALKTAEIAVACSAGNGGPYPGTSISPANYTDAFAVGAVDQSQSIASFSSRGPSACDGTVFPEMVAPGVNIKTSDLTYGGVFPDSYAYVSGTSFSAPHVAGAMALLLSAVPDATVPELESALKDSAFDLGAAGEDDTFGYGFLDVMTADLLLGQGQPPVCADNDGDGFYAQANCGTGQDCNDNDAAVYPGASEIKYDGIDQDCNGYDLTIDIQSAVYAAKKDTLTVTAASDLGKGADLELVGYGAMTWDRKNALWKITVRGAGGDPGTVTVSGIEGSETASTTAQ